MSMLDLGARVAAEAEIARRDQAEALLIAIGDFIDAKLAESRGFAKYNTVSDAKVKLFNQIMAVI